MDAPTAAADEYRPALDGVRCVAVYLVVAFHGGLAAARGGFIGVDLFFVLSGFLITNVLLADIDASGRIRFGRFYARRARRLLPAALLSVVTTSVVFVLIADVVERLSLVRDAQSALLYVANWRFLHEQNDYFATGVAKSPFLHFWSLGIEEQFYVVFPLLLLVLHRLGRRRSVLVTTLALLGVASVAAQLHWATADPNHAYYGTDARAYQLVAGAVLACALRGRKLALTARAAGLAAGTGLLALLLLGSGLLAMTVSDRGLAAAAAGVLLLGGLAISEAGWVGRLLAHPAPRYLGRISYSTYLWHWPVIVVLLKLTSLGALAVTAVAAVVSSGLAAASTALFELPIRRTPRLDPYRWTTVGAAVGTCALVAALLVPPILHADRRPVITTAADAARPAAATSRVQQLRRRERVARVLLHRRVRVPSLDWAAIANNNGPGRTCGVRDPERCVVVKGGRPSILLVGDSHARMLAPMMISLARKHHFTLMLNAISGCPWQSDLSNLHDPPAARAACSAARAPWYRDVLPKLHPDVVLLAEYPRDNPAVYGHTLVRTGGSTEPLHQLLQDTTNQTVAQIASTGARVVILKSIVISSFDPLVCLSRVTYAAQCDVPAPARPPFSDRMYTQAARQIPRVSVLDINRVVCPTLPVCPALIGRTPVWRNFNHYNPAILVQDEEQIWPLIERSAVLDTHP